jgi:hypothetical protein
MTSNEVVAKEMRVALLFAFLVAGGAQAQTYKYCDPRAPMADYRQCVGMMALQLEPGGDAPESIATAAVGACRTFTDPLAAEFTKCHLDGRAVVEANEDVMRDYAIRIAVQARAEKATRTKPSIPSPTIPK